MKLKTLLFAALLPLGLLAQEATPQLPLEEEAAPQAAAVLEPVVVTARGLPRPGADGGHVL